MIALSTKLLALVVLGVMICAVGSIAQNKKRNFLEEGASFEVGLDGFNLNNQYLLSHHGKEIQPVFDDSTSVHGKYSLRLDNPLGDKIYLAFRPIRLARTTNVTVSGYLKGDGATSVQLMRWQWSTVAKIKLPLTDKWKRFSFKGTIKNDQVYFLWILPSLDTKRIWIDALQIEEGELTDFHAKPLDFSIASTALHNTYKVGEDCALVAKIYAERPAARVPVTVVVLDIFRNEVLNKTVNIEMKGNKHAEMKIPLFKGNRRGSYKVIAEAKLGEHIERQVITFGVLVPVKKPDRFFGFQVKHIFNDDAERRFSENNEGRELVYSNVDPKYVNRLIRMVGASSVRCFRTTEWRKLEIKPNQFVWRDGFLKLQKDDGLDDPLLILNAHPPKWAKMIMVSDVKKYAFDKSRKAIPLMDHWKNYIRAMVAHYKGKTQYYEVVNEPETIFPKAAIYVDYLKEAHNVIREVDPNAKIVAPSYSGRRPMPWIREFVEAGGHKYTDIWAIHYVGRTFPEQGMDEKTHTWDLIRQYREILVKANGGKDKPFWNTEGGSFYWIEEYDNWPAPEQRRQRAEHWMVRSESLAAAYSARLQLIEKASEIDRLYSFEFGFYYSANASKSRDLCSRYVNYDGSPSPALVAYNAVAEFFAGTNPVELVPLAHHVVAVVFERDGKTVAGIWKGAPIGEWSGFEKYDPPALVDVALAPEKLRLVNMLGHRIEAKAQAGGVRFVATEFPVYFTSPLSPAEVVAAFKAAKLALGPRPKIDATYEQLVADRYYSAALALCEEKLTDNPKDVESLVRAGKMLIRLKRLEEAMKRLEKALAIGPDLPEANYAMGRCIHDLTQARKFNWFEGLSKAVPYLTKAVNGLPNDLELRYLLWYCAGPSDPALALEQIAPAMKINPKNFRTERMVKSRDRLQKALEQKKRRKR